MSFFDEGDEPKRRPRPRRPAAFRAGAGGGPTSGNDQSLLVRRAVAIGVGALLFILLILLVNSCRSNAKEQALRDYNTKVGALVQESDTQVSKSLFQVLTSGRSSPLDRQTEVNQLRVTAGELVDRAQRLDVRDEMQPAQRNLLQVLQFRREAIARIAEVLPTALGRTGRAGAVTNIAGQMQKLLASDVIYSQRVMPFLREGLAEGDAQDARVRTSRFLPRLDWLDPQTVGERLGGSAGGGTDAKGDPLPGLHGFGLTAVTAGGVNLQPDAPNRIPVSTDLAFDVKLQNQGENDESDVKVRVRVAITGAPPISVEKTLDQVKQGAEATVSIPLSKAPRIGRSATITVQVATVPGEKKIDNNRQTYPAIFTR